MPLDQFLDKCSREMRLQRLSKRTEETYLRTMRRCIEFHGGARHPKDMGVPEIRDYLTYLANDQNVAASTQEVAFNALLFLYRNILGIELPPIQALLCHSPA